MIRMSLKHILSLVACLVIGATAQAQLSLNVDGGYGSALQTYSSFAGRAVETPASFRVSLELIRFPDRQIRFGFAHSRSLQLVPFSSGVAYSSLFLRVYPFGPGAESSAHTGPVSSVTFGLKPFVVVGGGLSQGVIAGSTSFGGAGYGGAGIDWQFLSSFYFRLEGAFYKTFFNAENQLLSATLGLGILL